MPDRLISADALKKLIANHVYPVADAFNNRDNGMFWTGGIEKAIDEVPTVDAVEIVRCKDCSWCATVKSFGKEYLYCDAFYDHADGDLIGVSLMVEPDHYCSWGERREHGKNG